MKQIVVVTGNKDKLAQATACFKNYNISARAQDTEVDELQSHDPTEITRSKALASFKIIKKPLVVSDHSWAIHALNGFPGGYMKDVNKWFTADDFLSLLSSKQDRRATLNDVVVYTNGSETKLFKTEHPATIIQKPRGTGRVPFERVTILGDADKTIAEYIDKGIQALEPKSTSWEKFAKWYNSVK